MPKIKARASRNLYVEIQYMLGKGFSSKQICKKLECNEGTVSEVRRGRSEQGKVKICSVPGCNSIVPDDLHFLCRAHYTANTNSRDDYKVTNVTGSAQVHNPSV